MPSLRVVWGSWGVSSLWPDLLPPPPQYGIVLDAGSSHTAMFVYKWPADKENDTGVVSEHSMCDVKGKGCPSPREPVAGGRARQVPCGQIATMQSAPAVPGCLPVYSPVQ